MSKYKANSDRYSSMQYRKCGNSGIVLPVISLGFWHNFGNKDSMEVAKEIIFSAFDQGINYFDLANNYGPPAGSAEINVGKIINKHLKSHRSELFIASKAGHDMWKGPYGSGGSRKYLMSSLDDSLKRMKLDYFDVFYHHCPDPNTPLEESMHALIDMVHQGKALYAGISKYSPTQTREAVSILKAHGIPCLVHQDKYNMFHRNIESELLPVLKELGVGCVAFSPLAQGMLTDKYVEKIPKNSRAAKEHGFLQQDEVEKRLEQIRKLNAWANANDQKLSQVALQWVLRKQEIQSVIIGASSLKQLNENIKGIKHSLSETAIEELEVLLKA